MNRRTFQRALHMWPEWDASIRAARDQLDYDPGWPLDRAVGWIREHYPVDVKPLAEAELRRLRLPANLLDYWEDCFYCAYRRADGSVDFNAIRRARGHWVFDSQGNPTDAVLPGHVSLPRNPYQAALVWTDEEDIQDPWVRVEIMVYAPLASHDMLEAAARDAWTTVKTVRLQKDWTHPLADLIVGAKANRSEKKERAAERYRTGEATFEDLLEEEWHSPEGQEEIRRAIEPLLSHPAELQRKLPALQKRVYDRVRNWLPDPKPRAAHRGEWRRRLLLPPDFNGGTDSPGDS